ncbi:hypothetical protein M427DRAFT_262305 [Gonapodya prolifera JEL478]|uniref:Rieske domain-containing protein n=1 Tax=Gonapodya prolifera (strain JEL478) TaxID=1344416 RepID=A0A138ZWU6_GONPJ|nr:hypothetical protein M427DRAFT_262305 [Gonapodya prolifera JEL478]|eukprot:KXS08990.1 hypothetical protein M427DRAFT_262305 [Gonapodya prolifera JEL478]
MTEPPAIESRADTTAPIAVWLPILPLSALLAQRATRVLAPLLCPPTARDLALSRKYAAEGGESLAKAKRREVAVVARPVEAVEEAKRKGGRERIQAAANVIVEQVKQRLNQAPPKQEKDNVPSVVDLTDFGIDVYVVQASCPHAGGPLELGDIEELETTSGRPAVRCPLHSYDFDLVTGECFFADRRLQHVDAQAFRTSVRFHAPKPATGDVSEPSEIAAAENSNSSTPANEEPWIFIEYVLPEGSGAEEEGMLEVLEWEPVSTYAGARWIQKGKK